MNDVKKMLNKIRECSYLNEKSKSLPKVPITETTELRNFLEEAEYLMSRTEKKKLTEEKEQENFDNNNKFVITKTTPQFGDVYASQIDAIKKCINDNVTFSEEALAYYPENEDLVLNGKINAVNIVFQFKWNDASGEGLYIWANGCQLTDNNLRVISKIRDAYLNWKQALNKDSDLLEKLKKHTKK